MSEEFVLLKPFPGLEYMQAVLTVVLLMAVVWIAWRLALFLSDIVRLDWPRMGAAQKPANAVVPPRRLLFGPMFDDGETRWIRWSK